MKELIGHTSPETAHFVDDYPYGFRLRTQILYWVETKKGHGQRVVSQTRNPKTGRYNKPKAGIYHPLVALFIDETTGHVVNSAASLYDDETALRAFAERFPLTCAEERNAKTLNALIARARANARVTWRVIPEGEATQTPEEQLAIMRKLTAIELSKLRAEQEAK